MKTLLAVLLAFTVHAADVRVEWDYPPEEVSDVSFVVLATTNVALPVSQWQTLAVVPTTNAVISIEPGKRFFCVAASNIWGFAVSEVVSTPAAPRSINSLKIARQ